MNGQSTVTSRWEGFFRHPLKSAWRGIKALGAVCSTLLVRTHVRRWRHVAQDPAPVWDRRNRLMAEFIPSGSSVLDIGCGAQSLKRYLKGDCSYQPCDLIQSTPDVLVCDFNKGEFPEVRKRFDYVVCSGVFEYMRQPRQFLERVSGYGRVVLLSFHPLGPGQRKWQRLASNWVNHLPERDLLELFSELGLQCQILPGNNGHEKIYRLGGK
jgi:hypothetical protein